MRDLGLKGLCLILFYKCTSSQIKSRFQPDIFDIFVRNFNF
ncbi:MAG: hypothetical protein JWP12_3964 [Bacteroidetes bacterium]|nr:hypothetical protein [Bacteroidota bacterium]